VKTLFAKLAAFIGDISPKVKAGLNWGALAGLVIFGADKVTPDMLSWAGPYEPVLFSAIPIVAGQVAAWLKGDPLREAGKAAAASAPATPDRGAPVVNVHLPDTHPLLASSPAPAAATVPASVNVLPASSAAPAADQ
jgi:hypothetical protein